VAKQAKKEEVKAPKVVKSLKEVSRKSRNTFQRKCLTKSAKIALACMPRSIRSLHLKAEQFGKTGRIDPEMRKLIEEQIKAA